MPVPAQPAQKISAQVRTEKPLNSQMKFPVDVTPAILLTVAPCPAIFTLTPGLAVIPARPPLTS